MARFFGRYEHTLDVKGRVILPVRFRAAFDKGGFLAEHSEGCLALWTPEEFDKQMATQEEREVTSQQERNQVRQWASSSYEVELDRQGRLPIPGRLRAFAGLAENVLVTGVINRVELWEPTRWNEKIGPEEQRLADGLDR